MSDTIATSFVISKKLRFELRKAALEISHKNGKKITSSMIVEKAVKQFLKLKD